MAILFISSIVPDSKEFWNAAFGRSGNNVAIGIAEALPKNESSELLSCRPVPSFPNGPLWIAGEDVKLESGQIIHILPTFNIKVLKNIMWGVFAKKFIKKWNSSHSQDKRDIIVYNIYTPPVSMLYKICKGLGIKLNVIAYDLGVPPKRFGLGWVAMQGYKHMEKVCKKYLPLVDGRIVINEKMIEDYAPGKDYVLIDGGINQQIVDNLFELREPTTEDFTFLCAGKLWDQNGTKLILEAMKRHPELKAKVIFAGKGLDVPLIEEACKSDNRIQYVGMLTTQELFLHYESSDVLLNLRIEEEVDYHFPGKVQEYLVTGKHIISTPIAHAERDYGEYMSFLHDISPDGLASLMKEVMSVGKYHLYVKGKKARAFMLENRTWAARTNEILDYITR